MSRANAPPSVRNLPLRGCHPALPPRVRPRGQHRGHLQPQPQSVAAMDTDLLKTFLEVNRTRHFGKAAERLFLTQSAVSARIRQLEQALGVELFTRTRNNVQLTPQGERLLQPAEQILAAWHRAREAITGIGEPGSALAVGAVQNLWDGLLGDWLIRLVAVQPRLAVRAAVHSREGLLRRLREHRLDLAFAFDAPLAPDLVVRAVQRLRLVLVSTEPASVATQALHRDDYLCVDWGSNRIGSDPDASGSPLRPRLRIGPARLARTLLLARGGSAHLPLNLVAADLAAGRLRQVPDAPPLERTAYAFFLPEANRDQRLDAVLAGLAIDPTNPGGPPAP